jgi:hypothetical protein
VLGFFHASSRVHFAESGLTRGQSSIADFISSSSPSNEEASTIAMASQDDRASGWGGEDGNSLFEGMIVMTVG